MATVPPEILLMILQSLICHHFHSRQWYFPRPQYVRDAIHFSMVNKWIRQVSISYIYSAVALYIELPKVHCLPLFKALAKSDHLGIHCRVLRLDFTFRKNGSESEDDLFNLLLVLPEKLPNVCQLELTVRRHREWNSGQADMSNMLQTYIRAMPQLTKVKISIWDIEIEERAISDLTTKCEKLTDLSLDLCCSNGLSNVSALSNG
jgi:hypothetical protein